MYIPKDKYRLALISFLIFQAYTWAATIILVQIGSIKYPVRQFPHATQGSFILNFLIYPTVFTWFILIFPHNTLLIRKILHYIAFISAIVWFIYFIATYTDLQEFKKGTFTSQILRLYINFSIDFILGHLYIRWFSKKVAL